MLIYTVEEKIQGHDWRLRLATYYHASAMSFIVHRNEMFNGHAQFCLSTWQNGTVSHHDVIPSEIQAHKEKTSYEV